MSEYSQLSYWNDRYGRDSDPFEWFQDWGSLKHIILKYSNKNSNVLILGSGTSLLGDELYRSGDVQSVASIDFSSVAIDICKKRNQFNNNNQNQNNSSNHNQNSLSNSLSSSSSSSLNPNNFQYYCMDIRKMEFSNDKYDLLLDKGTLDSIMCGEEAEISASKSLSEINRVLIPGGIFISISHSPPEHREGLFKSPSDYWSSVQYITIPKPKLDDEPVNDEVHYVYIATKAKRK